MDKIYPASFYKDPSCGAVEEMEFLESMWRREKTGCRGCKHSPDAGLSCLIENLPGSWGYCKEWTDDTTR